MKVLFWLRSGSEIPGGHRIQADRTARELAGRGIEVAVSSDSDPPLGDFTVVHGFGLSPEDIRRCRTRGLAVCLSTVYCSRRWSLGLDQRVGGGFQLARRLRLAAVLSVAALRLRHVDKYDVLLRSMTAQRLAFESADVLLPNSALEAETIRAELGVTTPMAVVPNGIDPSVFGRVVAPSDERDDVVLYVGRLEPHKNQLGLIRALRRRPYKLILVGPPHPHHLDYAARCHREASDDVEFIDGRTQEDLVAVYQQARVHVLPSWYETTGLVSLEAATQGCNIVTTDRGYAREYFDESAWYCEPADERSIAGAVDRAVHAPYDPALRELILERFTWERAAQATLSAYERALADRHPGRTVDR